MDPVHCHAFSLHLLQLDHHRLCVLLFEEAVPPRIAGVARILDDLGRVLAGPADCAAGK